MRDEDARRLFELTLAKVSDRSIELAGQGALFEFFMAAKKSALHELPKIKRAVVPLDERRKRQMELDDEVKRLRDAGRTNKEIGQVMGFSAAYASTIYRRAVRRERWALENGFDSFESWVSSRDKGA